MDASRRWLDAERAVAGGAGLLAAYERRWEITWAVEVVLESAWQAGRISFKEYMRARYERLKAEIQWAEARERAARLLPMVAGPASALPFRVSDSTTEEYPLEFKRLAKAKFAALHSKPADLARAMLEAVRAEWEGHYREFVAGRASLAFELAAGARLLEAELAVAADDDAVLAAYERHWKINWSNEVIEKALTRWAHQRPGLHADEVRPSGRRAAGPKLAMPKKNRHFVDIGAQAASTPPFFVGDPTADDPLAFKTVAKGKFEALARQACGPDAVQGRSRRIDCEGRYREFLAGRGTLDFLLARRTVSWRRSWRLPRGTMSCSRPTNASGESTGPWRWSTSHASRRDASTSRITWRASTPAWTPKRWAEARAGRRRSREPSVRKVSCHVGHLTK